MGHRAFEAEQHLTVEAGRLSLRFAVLLITFGTHPINYNIIMATLADIEFYEKKVVRLETDLIFIQEELNRARTRLTVAEDYQLKYELLLEKYNQDNKLQRSRREDDYKTVNRQIEHNNELWEVKQKDLENKMAQSNLRLKQENIKLSEQLEQLRPKFDQHNWEEDLELAKLRLESSQKQMENLTHKIDIEREKHELQMIELRQIMETKVREKQEYEKYFYRDQITSLEQQIQSLETAVEQEREKASPERQKEIERLTKEKNQIQSTNSQEVKRLSGFIEEQITKHQKSTHEQALFLSELQKEKKENHQYIQTLEKQLNKKQEENEMELMDIKKRMAQIRQVEIDNLKNEFSQLESKFDYEREQWVHVLNDNNEEVARIKQLWEDDKKRFIEEKNKLKNKIAELRDRLKTKEENEIGETEQLLRSLKDLDEKDEHFSSYENAITFLDRQLKKATMKIEDKNREIKELISELRVTRKDHQLELEELKHKLRAENKKLSEKILELDEQIGEIEENGRAKEKELRKKEKDFTYLKEALEEENNDLKRIIEEMKRDYDRVALKKKDLELSYREERENVFSGKIDINSEKKKKFVELDRQKNDIEIAGRATIKRVKNQAEVQEQGLRGAIQKLQQENELLKESNIGLQTKIAEVIQQPQENPLNEYNKKMATLDLEIALTKNLYNAIHQVRKQKNEMEDVEENMSDKFHDDLEEADSMKGRYQAHDLQLSFNPKNYE